MPTIKMELNNDEIEMLLHCMDSAMDVLDLTNEERERVEKLRNELVKGLK